MRTRLGIAGALWGVLAMATAAEAADLPVAPAPVYLPLAFTWTGFYLGGNIGGAWARDQWSESQFGMNLSVGASGGHFIGGGELGFNYQIGTFVIGIDGDFDWSGNNPNATGNQVFIPAIAQQFQIVSTNKWVATAAARFGFAVGHVLLYSKAGGGWVGNSGLVVNDLTTGASIGGFNSGANAGWLVGGGVEWAVTDNWTVKLEYDYLGLKGQSFVIPPTSPFLVGDTFANSPHNLQMAKVGVNYLFNWGGPVVARY